MPTLPTLAVAKRDPVLRFLFTAALLFLGWQLLYSLVLQPDGRLDRMVIDNLVAASGSLLELLGHELIPEPAQPERTLGIQGGILLWIGNACNGVSVFAVFLIFLVSYPGRTSHIWWFAPLGLLTIHGINVLRIAALCIITSYDYELLNFNHDYTFQVIVYGWVFLLWFLWVKYFALQRVPKADP